MSYIPPTLNPTELFFVPPAGYIAPTTNPVELYFNDDVATTAQAFRFFLAM